MTRQRLRWIGIGVFIIIILSGLGLFIASQVLGETVATNDPVVQKTTTFQDETRRSFPILTGTNLEFTEQTIPADLKGSMQLIVVAYTVDQQEQVEAWLPYLEELNTDYPELAGYYVPVLPKDTADSALFIIGGMALYAQGEKDRQRTIVVFTDVDEFNEVLAVEGTDDIRLFLLNDDSEIIWSMDGKYTSEKLANLADTLAQLE